MALVKAELRQLRADHNRNFKIFSANFPVRFAFTFTPSDPNFPYDVDGVRLRFTLPEGYPQVVCLVEVDDPALPAPLNKKIADAMNEQARVLHQKGRPVVLALLRWLDQRGLPVLLSDAEFLASTYLTQTLEGLSQRRYVIHDPASYAASSKQREAATPARPEKAHAREHEGEEDEEGEEEEDDDDDEEEQGRGKRDDRPAPAPATAAAGGGGSQPPKAPKAIDLQCSGLTLANVGLVECMTLGLVVTCYRCSRQSEVTLVPGRPKNTECGGCRLPHTLALHALPVHEGSSLLGQLEADGCNPLDALPSNFAGFCFECGERNVFSALAFDRVTERTCTKCHNRMALAIHHLTFHKKKRPPPPGLVIPDKPKKKAVKIPGLKEGDPLPQHGACAHYSHSYRWLRFPCCGRAFPCDDCHNDASDHEAKWASKMVCGYCSVEQRCDEVCARIPAQHKDPTHDSSKY